MWLLLIIFAAAFFRFFGLGNVPAGLTWDEAAIGYNGYAIISTRRDEWLEKLPISFQSFGDYKSPLAIYVTGIFTYVFGLTPFVVRLPFAIAGVITIGAFYYICLQLYQGFANKKLYSLVSVFLLALSPWHIHFTRVGFESGMALAIFSVALALFLNFLSKIHTKPSFFSHSSLGVLATTLFVATLYTYHSAKIVVPLLVISTTVLFIPVKKILEQWQRFVVLVATALLLSWPLLMDTLYGPGATRAGVLLFSEQLSVSAYITSIASNYILHLSPQFLLQGATDSLRHGTGVWGVLLATTYLLAISGLIGCIRESVHKRSSWYTKIGVWSILVILVGLLPAVLTREVPHANRALFALPGFIVLATLGLRFLLDQVTQVPQLQLYYARQSLFGSLALLHVVLFLAFWQYYLEVYPTKNSQAFQEGYIEAFTLAKAYEKGEGGKQEVEKIIFSDEYQQPYIYALFVRRTNPIWYRGGSLVKYEFTQAISASDLLRNNTLIVATEKNIIPDVAPVHSIYGGDGSIRFALYLTEKNTVRDE